MMPTSLWSDPGTWIALGVSALFLVTAWVMHRVFLKVLKAPVPDPVPDSATGVEAHAVQPIQPQSSRSTHERHS